MVDAIWWIKSNVSVVLIGLKKPEQNRSALPASQQPASIMSLIIIIQNPAKRWTPLERRRPFPDDYRWLSAICCISSTELYRTPIGDRCIAVNGIFYMLECERARWFINTVSHRNQLNQFNLKFVCITMWTRQLWNFSPAIAKAG